MKTPVTLLAEGDESSSEWAFDWKQESSGVWLLFPRRAATEATRCHKEEGGREQTQAHPLPRTKGPSTWPIMRNNGARAQKTNGLYTDQISWC